MTEAADVDLAGAVGTVTATDTAKTAESSAARTTAAPGFGAALSRALHEDSAHVLTTPTANVPNAVSIVPASVAAEAFTTGTRPTAAVDDAGHSPAVDTDDAPDATDAIAVRAGALANASIPPAAPSTEPPAPERALASLAPEFHTRLERVVARMRDELGLEVRVVETWRSQVRQDALYAQGRTTDGPTVTWTRQSNHTRGLAADVIVGDSYANTAAYAKLATIAAEEGLGTLAGDPGHIELRDPAALAAATRPPAGVPARIIASIAGVARPAAVAVPAETAAPGRIVSAGTARIASIASVAGTVTPADTARVGTIAQTARTTMPARVGTGPELTSPARPAPPASLPVVGPPAAPTLMPPRSEIATVAPLPAAARSDVSANTSFIKPQAGGEGHAKTDGRTNQAASATATTAGKSTDLPSNDSEPDALSGRATRRAQPMQSLPAEAGSHDEARSPFSQAAPSSAVPVGSPVRAAGVDLTARIARALALRDAAEAAPATGVTLTVDGAEGTAARIRLGMRGGAVTTSIDMADPLAAADLGRHVDELRRALETQGLRAGALVVRNASPVRETAESARVMAASLAADTVSVSQRPAMDSGGNLTQQHRSPGSPRREHESPEHQPKRQSKEDRT